MTKEELEKKKSDLLYLFKEFDGDRKVEFITKFPEIWNDCYDIMEESRYHRVMQNSFKSGFDSAVALLLPRLQEAELKAKFIEQYLNPDDTSFRQMIDTFKSLSEDKKEKLINLTKSLVNMNEEK